MEAGPFGGNQIRGIKRARRGIGCIHDGLIAIWEGYWGRYLSTTAFI